MNEITLVTAFYDLNRQDWNGFERNYLKYINYFKFWARIRNKLIVYTDSKTAKEVIEIRRKFHLENKTIVHVCDDFSSIQPDIYSSINKAMKFEESFKFRVLKNVPEASKPDYNYLTILKTYFMADAVERGDANGMVSWIDFGYNHGGETIKNPEDFDFLWTYNFPDKINIFLIREICKTPLFETVRRAHTSIMGAIIVAPHTMCRELWEDTKKVNQALNICGFADDDQTIMQAVYELKPEIFNLIYTIWNKPMVICGGEHMELVRTRNFSKFKNILIKLYSKTKKSIVHLKYAVQTFIQLERGK